MLRSAVISRSVAAVCWITVLFLSGCAGIGYYYQSVHGHFSLMGDSRPISEILQDSDVDAGLKQRLELVLQMREFASVELSLPQNGSYLSYAALDRDAVVWSVVATPEFSVSPKEWCYPVVGCASYRGYFKREQAQGYADDLKKDGLDVTLLPNPAYSTLGWFDDPLPSTVIEWTEPYLVGLIVHELAHQQLYVAGDSSFNEAFAMAVEQVGVGRWFRSRNDMQGLEQWRQRRQKRDAFVRLLLDARERLQLLYSSPVAVTDMRARKKDEFARLQREYLRLKDGWDGYSGFDHWFEGDMNNARLASVATYDRFVPAFLKLLEENNGDLESFYQSCKELGALSSDRRAARLEALLQ